MALDYTTIGISIVVFVFYLMTIFTLIEIKKRLNKDVGIAFVYLIIAILILFVRRVQQILLEADIIRYSLSYFTDFVTLVFAVLFFIAIFSFYRSLKKEGGSKESLGEGFKDYKRSLGRKIVR